MKNVLLAVCGLSPQVITETLFALHQDHRKVDEVHVITTREGREQINAILLAGKTGAFLQYLLEYDIPKESILFGHDQVHVVCDENGNELSDIHDETVNEYLLKLCLDLTHRLTADPDTAVFFSIAGGRKTMSACLSLAAQMYGRPQDRLYHVLVSSEFENSRDFYYPPKESKWIELVDKKGEQFSKQTGYAKISLVHLPFFSIRNQLTPAALKEPKDPGTLMLTLIRETPAFLLINLEERKLVFKTKEADLNPALMALYRFFIKQKKDHCRHDRKSCGECRDCFLSLPEILERSNEIAEIYRTVCGTRPVEEMKKDGISEIDGDNFRMYKSKIKRRLTSAFGQISAQTLEIASEGNPPETRYGILIDRGRIRVLS